MQTSLSVAVKPERERKLLLRPRARLGPASPLVASILAEGKYFQKQPVLRVTVDDRQFADLRHDPSVEVFPDVALQPCTIQGAWCPKMTPYLEGGPGLDDALV